VGKPTKTKTVEFDDNKLILIDSHSQLRLDWSTLIESRQEYSTLRNRMRSADIMGVGTWGKIPQMPTIWGEMKTALLEARGPTFSDRNRSGEHQDATSFGNSNRC